MIKEVRHEKKQESVYHLQSMKIYIKMDQTQELTENETFTGLLNIFQELTRKYNLNK